MRLPAEHLELLDGPHTAVLAVLMAAGRPQASPVWFLREGDEIFVSSRAGGWRERHVREHGAVALTVFDPANPMSYVEVRGDAQVEDDPTAATRDAVVRKHGYDDGSAFDPPGTHRITIRITPVAVHGR
ncbi:MAG: PPOX class F420-dependent oxidoreductase [Actinomycetota bacterium]